jgi:hypothetical protein
MNTIDDMKQSFEALFEEKRQFEAKINLDMKEKFYILTKQFFEKNPSITAIVWEQYTPYFNDGEPCEFRVNSPAFTNATREQIDDIRWGEYNGEDEGVWAIKNMVNVFSGKYEWYKEELEMLQTTNTIIDVESCDLIRSVINSSEMENILYDVFGDHVQVIATRDGFEVVEFNHD